MATTEDTTTGHPVPCGVRALSASVTALAERPLFALDAATTRDTIQALAVLESKVTSLKLAVFAHADEVQVGSDTGCTSTGVWAANATRSRKNVTAAQVRLATALESRWQRVRDALAAGAMNAEQVRVVVNALEDLPDDLDAALLIQAEEALVGYAAEFDPTALQQLGAHILTLIAPEVGEEIDRKRLEAAEAKAAQKRRLTLSFDGHGSAHGRFTIPEVQGKMLQKLLHGFAAPGHINCTNDAEGEKREWTKGRPGPQKLGEAFCELIENYPRHNAPKLGRTDGTFIATTTFELLTTALGTATLDDGTPMTAAQAMRLACEARIIPVVLGGNGEVLHQGKARRKYTAAQTYAMHARDKSCTAKGCDWPPGLCHAHHDTMFSKGGKTDIEDGRLLCPHHHARAHDPAYDMTIHADNKVTFHRRT
ncbi:HNH endonuclease signature motif containing protein [Nocardioides sp. AX2bis]|uniref:HNH endonuclease signature motif containing protein n=1 Tax=Nocardioides sp. AX2bis TaxID=2653157 RepID=UPI0012F2D6A9|nr:HNH endonuclease signature motif containing protein [Nocardioides sp. AX2bis]VXB33344.1 HNH nuclease [Nocardioides sp. AX2bis]